MIMVSQIQTPFGELYRGLHILRRACMARISSKLLNCKMCVFPFIICNGAGRGCKHFNFNTQFVPPPPLTMDRRPCSMVLLILYVQGFYRCVCKVCTVSKSTNVVFASFMDETGNDRRETYQRVQSWSNSGRRAKK